MKRILAILVSGLLLAAATGCGGEPQKGIYKDKDKPKPAEKEKAAGK